VFLAFEFHCQNLQVARSVGMEFGAVVGIMYTLAQVVTIALNDVGFAESVVSLYEPFNFTGSHKLDVMVIGQAANLLMLFSCWLGVGTSLVGLTFA
jgi:amino acid transporter